MDKRIGILTLSASDNCGSLLQAYALQKYLESLGAKACVINFESNESKCLYSAIPPMWYKHPKKLMWSLIHYKKIVDQKKNYNEFRNSKLNLTKKKYTCLEDFSEIDKDINVDVIITGSDQIWNLNMTDYSECFFAPFSTKAKKVAYAASLGAMMEIPPEKRKSIHLWLNDYVSVSVREPEGAKTLSQIISNEVPVLCDPTMLLGYDFWIKEAGARSVENAYIFYYSWAYNDETMNRIVQKFADEKKLAVYVINPSKWYKHNPRKYDFCIYEKSSPDTFLNLVAHASYVFVQSFHGCVFANLLRKNFFFLNEQQGTIDFRSGNLLKILDEEKRIVQKYEDIEDALHSELSWNSEKLDVLIKMSKKYLEDVL